MHRYIINITHINNMNAQCTEVFQEVSVVTDEPIASWSTHTCTSHPLSPAGWWLSVTTTITAVMFSKSKEQMTRFMASRSTAPPNAYYHHQHHSQTWTQESRQKLLYLYRSRSTLCMRLNDWPWQFSNSNCVLFIIEGLFKMSFTFCVNLQCIGPKIT